MNEEQVKLAKRLLREGKSVSEVARAFGVHRATIYRVRLEYRRDVGWLSG